MNLFWCALMIALFRNGRTDVTPIGRGCSERDSDYEQCLQERVSHFLPHIKNGVPSIGISPADPLYREDSPVQIAHTFISGTLDMKKINFHGLSNATFSSIVYNVDDSETFTATINTKIPLIQSIGNFNFHGTFMTISIVGEGDFFLKLRNAAISLKVSGKREVRQGKTFLLIEKYEPDIQMEKMISDAKNVVGISPRLVRTIMKFVNWFDKAMFNQGKPFLVKFLHDGLKPLANELFTKVALEETIPFDVSTLQLDL